MIKQSINLDASDPTSPFYYLKSSGNSINIEFNGSSSLTTGQIYGNGLNQADILVIMQFPADTTTPGWTTDDNGQLVPPDSAPVVKASDNSWYVDMTSVLTADNFFPTSYQDTQNTPMSEASSASWFFSEEENGFCNLVNATGNQSYLVETQVLAATINDGVIQLHLYIMSNESTGASMDVAVALSVSDSYGVPDGTYSTGENDHSGFWGAGTSSGGTHLTVQALEPKVYDTSNVSFTSGPTSHPSNSGSNPGGCEAYNFYWTTYYLNISEDGYYISSVTTRDDGGDPGVQFYEKLNSYWMSVCVDFSAYFGQSQQNVGFHFDQGSYTYYVSGPINESPGICYLNVRSTNTCPVGYWNTSTNSTSAEFKDQYGNVGKFTIYSEGNDYLYYEASS
ncbi:hypothetical protein [Photorhabdus sp. CRCIA-P01]|uniref:hypothetical protein n=1 Tax=Photorhabdus sp. CRCIA-P01 TaxID=2019570 RepID=UPI000E59A26A|nr:hypothetical protein [Photorhabdus sp. CRCIA-P01]